MLELPPSPAASGWQSEQSLPPLWVPLCHPPVAGGSPWHELHVIGPPSQDGDAASPAYALVA